MRLLAMLVGGFSIDTRMHRGAITRFGGIDVDRRGAGQRRQLRGTSRRPGGVRPLCIARRAGAGAGHRRSGFVLARRGRRGDRGVGRPYGRRSARSPGWTVPGAAIWLSSSRRRRVRSKPKSFPISLPALAITSGMESSNRCRQTARPVGEPGSGSTSALTAAPDFIATTATSWSPISIAVSCRPG